MAGIVLASSRDFLTPGVLPKYLSVENTSPNFNWVITSSNERTQPIVSFYSSTRRINQVLALNPIIPVGSIPKFNEFNAYVLNIRNRNAFLIRFFKTLILKAPSLIENDQMPLYEKDYPLYSSIVKKYYSLNASLNGRRASFVNCINALVMIVAVPIFVIYKGIRNPENYQWSSRCYRLADVIVSIPTSMLFSAGLAITFFKRIFVPQSSIE